MDSGIRYSIDFEKFNAKHKDDEKDLDEYGGYELKDSDTTLDGSDKDNGIEDKNIESKHIEGNGIEDNDRKDVRDVYNSSKVANIMQNRSLTENVDEAVKALNKNLNPTFADKMLQYINEKGLKDSDVYKAAQIDKRLFSKIVTNRRYKPSKDTVIAIACGLKLTLEEATDLLKRAGYAFSHSCRRDVIIEYFFREQIYNLMDINAVLFEFFEKTIGRF